MTNATAKFRLHIAPVLPGDFGPVGYAVFALNHVGVVTIKDGAVVEALGEVEVSVEHEFDDEGGRFDVELGYRKVRTEDGFEGTVCWHEFDGRSGFEAI